MVVMKPIFTLEALHHERVLTIHFMWFLAMAVTIEESLIIKIPLIFVIFFIVVNRTRKWHPTVTTVTSKINLSILLYHIMSFMTMRYTAYTKSMWFDKFFKL